METQTQLEKTTVKASSENCPQCTRPMRMMNFGTQKIKTCDPCARERLTKAEERREAIRQDAINNEMGRFIKNAAIAPRFRDKTLSNWQATLPEQREVMIEVEAFLEAPSTGLIFCGRPGTGKNHLACAIAKVFIQRRKSALVTTVFKMIRAIKETWRGNNDESKVIKGFVDVQLLVIDEIGIQFGSETEMLYLQEIINDRYEAEKPTILISNKTPEEITAFLGERIIDRFRDGGHILCFDWESYRGRKS